MQFRLQALAFACVFALIVGSAAAAEWGTLKGQLIYDGKPPAPQKANVNKDLQVCTKHHPVDESLLVGEKGGLKNVVIYIRVPRGEKLDVHPDYAETAEANVPLDNLHCRFDPHICLLRTSQTLLLKNSDSVGHNTKGDCLKNVAFNVLIPPNSSLEHKLPVGEILPVPVGCNIHPWMAGYLVVREDPYMAASAEDGTFEIKKIPAGEHEFQFWHEKSGYLSDVSIAGEPAKRGRVTLNIEPGTIDLGQIKVDPALFEK